MSVNFPTGLRRRNICLSFAYNHQDSVLNTDYALIGRGIDDFTATGCRSIQLNRIACGQKAIEILLPTDRLLKEFRHDKLFRIRCFRILSVSRLVSGDIHCSNRFGEQSSVRNDRNDVTVLRGKNHLSATFHGSNRRNRCIRILLFYIHSKAGRGNLFVPCDRLLALDGVRRHMNRLII